MLHGSGLYLTHLHFAARRGTRDCHAGRGRKRSAWDCELFEMQTEKKKKLSDGDARRAVPRSESKSTPVASHF